MKPYDQTDTVIRLRREWEQMPETDEEAPLDIPPEDDLDTP